MKMKDTLDFNINFIEQIKVRPCLYDSNRSDYRNRDIQDAAWVEISHSVEESVADCKERWKNLRGAYTRHLKRMASGPGTKFVKPYYLTEYLEFLEGFTRSRPSKESYKLREAKSADEQNPLSDMEDSVEVSDEDNKPEDNVIQFNENVDNKSYQNKKRKKRTSSQSDTSLDNCETRQKTAKYESQDPDFAFFYSLLPDIKDMTQEQKRRFKMGVLNLADTILQEKS